jgi:hypothetical protein
VARIQSGQCPFKITDPVQVGVPLKHLGDVVTVSDWLQMIGVNTGRYRADVMGMLRSKRLAMLDLNDCAVKWLSCDRRCRVLTCFIQRGPYPATVPINVNPLQEKPGESI